MNRILLLLGMLFLSSSAWSLCVAVGPSATGNGSGSDWNNRRAGLPTGASMVRGNTYYLMDGSYGSMYFSTANSGATIITIKKAQTYDYGRASDGCPNDISAGWNAGTMGAAQAVFDQFDTSGASAIGYLTVDGNGANTAIGCGSAPNSGLAAKDCGIKFALPLGTLGGDVILVDVGTSGSTNDNITFRSVEMVGGYPTPIPPGDNETMFKCTNSTCSNLLIEHNYWHDAGCDFMKPSNSNSMTFRYNYVRQNANSISCHAQFFLSDGTINNSDWYGNIIRDIEGTAIWSILNGGHVTNMRIFSNVITWSQGSTMAGTANGIIACINSGSRCTNVQFIGNALVNVISAFNGAAGVRDENGGGSHTWKNNLIYLCTSRQGGTSAISFSMGGSTFTEDHNTWLGCGTPASGTADVTVQSSPPNPFVNWPASNFHLASPNAFWSNAVNMAPPFTIDLYGNTHGTDGTWDRGAADFGAGVTLPPPINLRVL